MESQPILDACCGGRMFWKDKMNPHVLFMDKRQLAKGGPIAKWNPGFHVTPDLVADFTDMPFQGGRFKLVVWDPPHLWNTGANSVLSVKYGRLDKATWPEDLKKGFEECWRVLDDYGVLIFKWAETDIKLSEVLKLFPEQPLFGDITGKSSKTRWMTFMKIPQ